MLQILPAYPLEEMNSLVIFFHSVAHPSSSLHSLLPPLEILICLLVFEPPPNSLAYPHELKNISRSYHTPFPVIKQAVHSIVIHFNCTCIMLLLNHFTFLCFNCFCLCMYLFSLQIVVIVNSESANFHQT